MEQVTFWLATTIKGRPVCLLRQVEGTRNRGFRQHSISKNTKHWRPDSSNEWTGIGGASDWEPIDVEAAVRILAGWGLNPDPLWGVDT